MKLSFLIFHKINSNLFIPLGVQCWHLTAPKLHQVGRGIHKIERRWEYIWKQRAQKRSTHKGEEPGAKASSPYDLPPKHQKMILLTGDLPCERTQHGKGRVTWDPYKIQIRVFYIPLLQAYHAIPLKDKSSESIHLKNPSYINLQHSEKDRSSYIAIIVPSG